jgi:outer membrane receptor protein involved in Fe transport
MSAVRTFSRHSWYAACADCAILSGGDDMSTRTPRRLRCAALIAAAFAAPAAAQTQLDRAEVIGTSPLPGQGIDRNLLPYDTQVVRRRQLDAANGDNLTDVLSRRQPGFQMNEIQGSPFQPDLTFRGFRASGLIGASQGLSVYLDGVRINEPFGDVVNWDLLPEFSVESVTLVPGANPAFGLNTIGGAISFTTLSGQSAPGLRVDAGFGSFGRKRLDASYGRSSDAGWHQYAGITLFDEDGWRDESKGDLAQALVKLGRDSGATQWNVGVLAGRSTLIGNGLVPAYTIEDGVRTPDLYASRREAIYTHPDKTRNELLQVAFNASHRVDEATLVDALVYLRSTRRTTVNGDTSDDFDPAEPDENASLNGSRTRQDGGGIAAALSKTLGTHRLQFGATLDASKVRFRQEEAEGSFDATRGVVGGDEEAELAAEVSGRSTALGVYVTDTWSVRPSTHLTATLRANHARVSNTLTSVDDDTGDIEQRPRESFRYNALNPALGVAQGLGNGITLFANVARNNRVPTVIELGCADPEEPCRLPAGLQSDPFLEQVRSTTLELGARGTTGGLRWSVSAYRTDNRDDILFGSVSLTGQLGYFRNFDKTRHAGIDAQVEASFGPVDVQAGYSHLRATYEAADTLRLGDRNVAVRPGTRIAGLPRHALKIGADWRVLAGLTLGGDVQAFSGRGTLGNEDGLAEDGDGETVDLGLPGHAVLNLRASWKPAASWELFARVNNVTGKRYETFGAVAGTVFDAQGNFTGDDSDAVFVAPGAPRSLFVGAKLRF